MKCPLCKQNPPKDEMTKHLEKHIDSAYRQESYYYNLGENARRELEKYEKRNSPRNAGKTAKKV